jgi:hypothetical protein
MKRLALIIPSIVVIGGLAALAVLNLQEHSSVRGLTRQLAAEHREVTTLQHVEVSTSRALATALDSQRTAEAKLAGDNRALAVLSTTTTTIPIVLPDPNTLTQALTTAFSQIGDSTTQQQVQSFVAQEDSEAERGIQVDPQADATAFADQADPAGVIASNAAQFGNILSCMSAYTAACAAEGIQPTP